MHGAGGGEALNAYHYVSGNLLQARDPLGLNGPITGGFVEPEGARVSDLVSAGMSAVGWKDGSDAMDRYGNPPSPESTSVEVPAEHINELVSRNGEVDSFYHDLKSEIDGAMSGGQIRRLLPPASFDPSLPFAAEVVRERTQNSLAENNLPDNLFVTYGQSTFRMDADILYTPSGDGTTGTVEVTATLSVSDSYDFDPETTLLTRILDNERLENEAPAAPFGQTGELPMSTVMSTSSQDGDSRANGSESPTSQSAPGRKENSGEEE